MVRPQCSLDEDAGHDVHDGEDGKGDVEQEEALVHGERVQRVVVEGPIVASRHGHEQGQDGPVQGCKVLDQVRVPGVLKLIQRVQEDGGCRGEGDPKHEERHCEDQNHPGQRLHRPQNGEDHHAKLPEEPHDPDDPGNAHDPHHPGDPEHGDVPENVALRAALDDQVQQAVGDAQGDDKDVENVPPHVVATEEVSETFAEPAEAQLDAEEHGERHLQRDEAPGRVHLHWGASAGVCDRPRGHELRLPTDEHGVQEDERAADDLVLAAHDEALERRLRAPRDTDANSQELGGVHGALLFLLLLIGVRNLVDQLVGLPEALCMHALHAHHRMGPHLRRQAPALELHRARQAPARARARLQRHGGTLPPGAVRSPALQRIQGVAPGGGRGRLQRLINALQALQALLQEAAQLRLMFPCELAHLLQNLGRHDRGGGARHGDLAAVGGWLGNGWQPIHESARPWCSETCPDGTEAPPQQHPRTLGGR
mmetsp:Transcript_81507/g.253021  ORF Transcript_81507/g.253021 Transcript_81507/m.253021 type:complete len:482 (-) Transcript_81507:7-1452(-)